MLMPRPPMWALFGCIDSAISTPRRRPSNILAVSVVSPRVLPSVTTSPSAMASDAASAGWIITVGAPSRASEDGVSLKVLLRKLRDGLVARRRAGAEPDRVRFIRLLDNGPVIRQRRHLLPRPHPGDAEGRMRPVGL